MKDDDPNRILNDVDEQMLFILARMPLCTSKQIKRLCTPQMAEPSLRRRLRALKEDGLVGVYGGKNVGFRKLPYIYFITDKGYKFLSDVAIEELPVFKKTGSPTWSSQFLHRTYLMDMMISLELALRKIQHIKLMGLALDFRRNYASRPETSDDFVGLAGDVIKIVPDMAFALHSERTGNTNLFLVEVDCATETILASDTASGFDGSLLQKFRRYEEYLQSEAYQAFYEAWGVFSSFRLLLITTSEERIENIRFKLMEKYPVLSKFVLFSTIEEATRDILMAPWVPGEAGETGPRYLVGHQQTTAPNPQEPSSDAA